MRFFHISDLHIGLKLINRDLREDQEYILKRVVEYAVQEQPDAIVIAGDIYDKAVPSAEAVEVFDHFIAELTEAVPETVIMMISGNHDSAPRVNCFRSVLSRQKLYMIGMPPQREEEQIEKVTLTDAYGPVNFYLLPFVKPSMVKQIVGVDENGNNLSYEETLRRLLEREQVDPSERNVLVSHQFYLPAGKKPDEVERMSSEVRTVGDIDEIPADVLKPFDYAALGHIHKPMKVGCEAWRYCGTPLACSVSEAGQTKGIILVELGGKGRNSGESGDRDCGDYAAGEEQLTGWSGPEEQEEAVVRTTVLPLIPLRQVRVVKGSLEEVLQQGSEDYVTVILTDQVDLDVLDMQDRLRAAFPNLLEIRRETLRKMDYSRTLSQQSNLNPFELCCAFMTTLDAVDKEILQDVINTAMEVK